MDNSRWWSGLTKWVALTLSAAFTLPVWASTDTEQPEARDGLIPGEFIVALVRDLVE